MWCIGYNMQSTGEHRGYVTENVSGIRLGSPQKPSNDVSVNHKIYNLQNGRPQDKGTLAWRLARQKAFTLIPCLAKSSKGNPALNPEAESPKTIVVSCLR